MVSGSPDFGYSKELKQDSIKAVLDSIDGLTSDIKTLDTDIKTLTEYLTKWGTTISYPIFCGCSLVGSSMEIYGNHVLIPNGFVVSPNEVRGNTSLDYGDPGTSWTTIFTRYFIMPVFVRTISGHGIVALRGKSKLGTATSGQWRAKTKFIKIDQDENITELGTESTGSSVEVESTSYVEVLSGTVPYVSLTELNEGERLGIKVVMEARRIGDAGTLFFYLLGHVDTSTDENRGTFAYMPIKI